MKTVVVFMSLLFIITRLFSNSNIATTTSDMKGITFHYDGLLCMDSIVYEQSDQATALFLSPGIYQVNVKDPRGWLTIPVYVDHSTQQEFYLFGLKDLDINLKLSDETSRSIKNISLSAVKFRKIAMSLIGKRSVILESEVISQTGLSFHIVTPIFNTSVENYILSVIQEDKRYENYMILKQGILTFLKGVEAIALEEKDKKISLFESEWVAQNRQTSGIVYRDGVQEIKSTVIKTDPPGSDLYIGNEFLGHTPYELFLKEDVPVFITIKHEGYFDREIKLIRAELEAEQVIQLTQIEDGGVQF